jgi:hypothetical protein
MNLSGLFLIALPLLGQGSRVDVAAKTDLQVRAGLLPVPGQQRNSGVGVEGVFTPEVGIRRLTRRTTALVSYFPRFYLRLPSILENNRTLIFHQFQAQYTTAMTRRLQLVANGNVGVGELNFADIDLVFDPGTGVTNQQIIPLFRVTGGASVSYMESAQHSSSIGVRAGYRDPLDDQSQATMTSAFPTSGNVSAVFSHMYRPAERLSVQGAFTAGRIVSGSRDTSMFAGTVTFNQVTGEQSNLSLGAGASYAVQNVLGGSSIFPTANVGYSTTLRANGLIWQGNASGGVSAFFDELSAEYRPQMTLRGGLQVQSPRNWRSGANLVASLPLTAQPRSGQNQTLQTRFSLVVPFSISLGKGFSFNLGIRCGLRGPHPSVFDDGPIQPELAGFTGLTYRLGTGASRGNWL